jgi:hypothetical protein
MESLMAEKRTRTCVLGMERTLLVVGGHSKRYMKVAYDQEYLPVLAEAHPLSRLYLEDSHARDHGGADSMVMRSRNSVWIMAARRLAKRVRDHCFTCKYLAKKCGEQLMGPLPENRMGPAPVFESTAVDLFGPLSFQDPYNKRRTGKAWGVVFVCMATSLVHVEVTESYSTDSFLMALRRFMTVHGAPRRFPSDQGDQLVAASKQLATWNWAKVDELCSQRGATWRLVPTGGQHHNGHAERVIGMMKLCLAQTLEGKRCSLMELATVLSEAAQAVNSRPIARSKPSEDPTSEGPITPLHLQLGRASIEIPEVRFDLNPSLTKLLRHLE